MNAKIMGTIASALVASLLFAPVQTAFAQNVTAEIDYTIKIGKQKHLVHMTVCAENENVINPKIILQSPQETKHISYKKILAANTCQVYEVPINAKHANKITLEAI